MRPDKQNEVDILLGQSKHIYDLTISFQKEEDRKTFIKLLNQERGKFTRFRKGIVVGAIASWIIMAFGVLVHMAFNPM